MYLDYLQIWIEYLLDSNPAADTSIALAVVPFSPEPHLEN